MNLHHTISIRVRKVTLVCLLPVWKPDCRGILLGEAITVLRKMTKTWKNSESSWKKYGFIISCLLNCGWQQCPGRGNFWKPPPGLWPPLSVSGGGSINCCPKTVRLSSQQANTLLCKWRIKSENLANNLVQKLHNHHSVMVSNLQCL